MTPTPEYILQFREKFPLPTIDFYIESFLTTLHDSAVEEGRNQAVEALIWCSGSPDFQEGGIAREGWLKLCQPIIESARTTRP